MASQSLFDLKRSDVVQVLEQAVGTPIDTFTFTFRHEITGHAGHQGEKLIPTFDYTTYEGRRGQVVVFVKRHAEQERIESEQFLHAERHNAPIPKLYGAVRDAENREILFIEHLDRIYTDAEVYRSADLLRSFVRLVARLNALSTDKAYERLPKHGALHRIPGDQVPVVQQIAARARQHDLGDRLARRFGADANLELALAVKLRLLGQVTAGFPMGFVHGDLWPYHVGSRKGSDAMLAVDLGLSLLGARFFDIAPFVGPSDDLPSLALGREEIAVTYLEDYVGPCGVRSSLADFLAEADAVWLAWNSRRLGWLLRLALGGDIQAQDTIWWLLDLLQIWEEGEQVHSGHP